jgi:hypothetical protein
MPNASLTLNVGAGIAPGKTEIADIHQDSGDGYGYQKLVWRRIRIEHRQGSITISYVGDFRGQPIRYIEAVGIAADPKEIRADGRKLEHKYDAATRRVRVELTEGVKEITLVR